MSTYVFDIETNGLLDEVSKCHSIVLKDIETGEVDSWASVSPRLAEVVLEKLLRADLLIGHNIIKYDLPAIAKLYPEYADRINAMMPSKVLDTLLMSRLIWPHIKDLDYSRSKKYEIPAELFGRHSLKAWGYRLGILKGGFAETTDWSEWSPEMQEYCEQDVEVNEALYLRTKEENYFRLAIDIEHRFATVLAQQERHGFWFNEGAAVELEGELLRKREEIETELQGVFPPKIETMNTPAHYLSPDGAQWATKKKAKEGGWTSKDLKDGPLRTKEIPFNPGSRDQIYERLHEKYGWKPSKYTPSGKPQIDESVLDSLSYPEAKLLSRYLFFNKIIGMVSTGDNAWLKLVGTDNRIHGEVNTCGAVTGRCTHMRPNMSQVPKVQVGPDGVKRGEDGGYGWECRSLFGVPPGRVLVGADASGLELRCLGHYMAPYDNGEFAREVIEGDVHTKNQLAAGLESRDKAKTFIYAFLKH